jgi:thiol-disulfide isomerase/thioredoxin
MKTALPIGRPAFFCLIVLFGALLLLSPLGAGASPEPGGKSPQFRLKSLDGRNLGPKDFRGKVVVVDFWATWCVPCQVQSRILESIYKDYQGNKGVQFLAANVAEEEATVRRFLEKKPMPYPVLLDPGEVSGDLGVYALPSLLVIDKKGVVTFFQQGLVDDATLRKILKQAGA